MADLKTETDEKTEGTVQWDKMTEFMQGDGTPAEGAEASGDDAVVEVPLRGRTLRLPAEDAAALEAYKKEIRDRDGRLGGELQAAKERLARLEGRVEATTKQPEPTLTMPDPMLATTDIKRWQTEMTAYNAAKLEQMRAELRDEYERDKTQTVTQLENADKGRRWADEFFSSNPELKSPRLRKMTSDLYIENAEAIEGIESPEEQYKFLARKVREAAKDIGSVIKADRPLTLEGGSSARKPVAGKADKFVPRSTLDWSRERRAAMREGFGNSSRS